ncbi:hypothetical protein BCR44DRAFT_1438425 [Catenaria anguillulae PL171]|uniref:Uncharacterized protein n=1 Tax=Catenaria anguillulae PL171 TaxID=765915 RepID=A0A1Y2HFP5_9FUNG|nr:hypothetical protein BCR44DRAFT_1438425 [Catenaria anguillulae PL171]
MPASSNQLTVGSTATAPAGGWGRVQFPDYERPSAVGSPVEMSPVTSVVGNEAGGGGPPSRLRDEVDVARGVHVMTPMREEELVRLGDDHAPAPAPAGVPMSPTLVDPWMGGGQSEGEGESREADSTQHQGGR